MTLPVPESGAEDAQLSASDQTHSEPADGESHSDPSYIIGIGASAGGLEAIESFFDNMPPETGMAFVIVQHLSPDFKSLMDELLARHTKMKIHLVEDGVKVEANQVYLIPSRKNMVLRDGRLRLEEQAAGRSLNLPIDIFFESLAADAANRAIAVVLSGTGSDGSRGLQRVHESGGLVLGQSAATAGFDGMPKSAKATGMVDVVTSPAAMPGRILQYIKMPEDFQRGVDDEESTRIEGDELGNLYRVLRRQFGIDFARYRPSTTNRRIDRRLQLTGCKSLLEYMAKIDREPRELDVLYRDLLVEVTQFFRDTAAFARIRDDVVPNLLRDCAPDGQIRCWVPACATGEEAYSLAMLIRDCQSRMPDRGQVDVKIFATDVHQTSLETASAGVYSSESVATVPLELREKYFSRSQDLYHVVSQIRQMVIFAPHDITSDPPFTKIDLISCRNALIYLIPDVQRKVIALFHFGLRVGGCLFLGPSESLSEAAGEFDTIDAQWRIFAKTRDVRLAHADNQSYSQPLRHVVRSRPSFVSNATQAGSNWLIPEVHEVLLREYVPPSFLINAQDELLHSFGNAREMLTQPEGKATLDVLRMVSGELRIALSAALQRVRSSRQAVVMKAVPIKTENGSRLLRIVAKPYAKSDEELVLICLENEPEGIQTSNQPAGVDYDLDDQSSERIVSLERELAYTKESLQSTVEELETSNEELQSTNEELVASNEELQSTNEELHSVNEELHTVNTEHQLKIQELVELTGDMDNLLKSTEIGTIFLDQELRIRKFTPAIGEAFYMLQQDVGRPIEHIASNLDVADLHEEVRSVLRTDIPIEREARNRDGRVFLLRIQPYRDENGTPSGVVLTCVDVSAMIQSYDDIRRTAETLQLTDHDLQEFAYAVSHDLQAPLRHISNHSRQLREKYQDPSDIEAVESFTAINSCIAKLESMIVGLLRYSRVYSLSKPFVETDLTGLVDTAVRTLEPLITEYGAVVKYEQLPTLNVDPEQFMTVFTHLITNSIMFSREMSPNITIEARRLSKSWEIDVSDDGIGIAVQHRDRVFVIFERLEFRTVPGEGMGLPLCKRILQRHSGSISAQNSPTGRGVTMRISLPLEADEE
ncbi:chemotaxis protein CheB [Neorhodopirellula lusitana]|uniref:chemotaxis protein CheB n=1 Tax=Neorhodopirellula lusitana TaxID=445327 RepID=UPI00384FADC3